LGKSLSIRLFFQKGGLRNRLKVGFLKTRGGKGLLKGQEGPKKKGGPGLKRLRGPKGRGQIKGL